MEPEHIYITFNTVPPRRQTYPAILGIEMKVINWKECFEQAHASQIGEDLEMDEGRTLKRHLCERGGEAEWKSVEEKDGGCVAKLLDMWTIVIEKHLRVMVCKEKTIQ